VSGDTNILTFISWLRGRALMKNMAWLSFSGSYWNFEFNDYNELQVFLAIRYW
jgi:hypothetical protein